MTQGTFSGGVGWRGIAILVRRSNGVIEKQLRHKILLSQPLLGDVIGGVGVALSTLDDDGRQTY